MILQSAILVAGILFWYTGSFKFRTAEESSTTRVMSWALFQITAIIAYTVIVLSSDASMMTEGILNLDFGLYYDGTAHSEFPMLYALLALWMCDFFDPTTGTMKKYSDLRRIISHELSRVKPQIFKASALIALVGALACFA